MPRTTRPPLATAARWSLPLAALLLPSCGLVQAPFRVAGGLVNATAEVASAAVEAPIEGHRKRKARREEKERQREAEEKQRQAEEERQNAASTGFEGYQGLDPGPLPAAPPDAPPPADEPGALPDPIEPELPPFE